MAAASGLPFRDLREHPGSLGSYAGRDLGILAITYELGRRSALQALTKYAGCMNGPPDLSTNKQHLEGLGRGRRR